MFDSCKCGFTLSACFSVPLVVLDLVTGSLMLLKKGATNSFEHAIYFSRCGPFLACMVCFLLLVLRTVVTHSPPRLSRPSFATDEFFDYLNDHVSDDGNVTSLQNWYQTLSVAFFVLAALQLVRCVMSRKVVQYSKLDSKELRAAFLDDAAEARERREENQNEVLLAV